MGTLENSKTLIPNIINKDCSKRICSLHCTQWCKYIILPSPSPPPRVVFSDDNSGGTTLSPVVIALIGILAGAFLLIVYYIVMSLYCVGNDSSSRRGVENQEILDFEIEMEEDDYNDQEHDPTNYEPWYVSRKGLDEALINSIRVCKYKKGDGLVSCTDCSVCLGEFQEYESIRVLPKCSHAFHVYCIDTWLKSHSNCPLCRANVCYSVSVPVPVPIPVPGAERVFEDNESSSESRNGGRNVSRRVASDLGTRDAIVHIREGCGREVRRSSSMDSLCQIRVSIANQEEIDSHKRRFDGEGGSSKQVLEGNDDIKRSFGSERYFWINKALNGKNKEVLPL